MAYRYDEIYEIHSNPGTVRNVPNRRKAKDEKTGMNVGGRGISVHRADADVVG